MNRLFICLASVTAVAAATSGNALAANAFGASVSSCARMHLGQRTNPATLTCTHDGTIVTFANFGDMVPQMQGGC